MQSLARLTRLARLAQPLRPTVKFGILLAVGVSVLIFVSTPFLIPEISDHYSISTGAASMISTLQLAGFMLATWGAGRWLQPRERMFVITLLATAATNLLSAPLPAFTLLVALRFISGCTQGLLAWYGWVQAFGDERRMGDVAMAGPVVSVLAAPVMSMLITAGGAQLVFVFLAAVSLTPLLFQYQSEVRELPRLRNRGRAVPAALILLVCLGVFTLGGSSVFVYTVVLGTENAGLSNATIAVGFSLSSFVGIPAAKWRIFRRTPSLWMTASAVCAVTVCTTSQSWMFVIALVCWGFFFWAAGPGVFEVLASRSLYPEERAGDAQAFMAAGRTVGPLMGGLIIDGPGSAGLGIVAGSLILLASLGVITTTITTKSRHSSKSEQHQPSSEPPP